MNKLTPLPCRARRFVCFALVLAAVASSSCKKGAKAGEPAPKSEIDRIRQEAQGLIEQQNKLRYAEWNDGVVVNLPETYRGHEHLVSSEMSHRLLSAINQTVDGRLAKALRHLRVWVIEQVVGREVLSVLDQIEALETSSITFGDSTFAFNELQRKLSKEPDAQKRHDMYLATLPVAEQLATLHIEHQRKQREAAKLVGFASELELLNELRATDVSRMGPLAQQLLNETDALYIGALKNLSKSLVGLEADKLRPSDNARLMRQPGYDVAIAADSIQPMVERTWASLGFSFGPPTVAVDASQKPLKNPLTQAFAISVPKDVRVSMLPIGGVGPLEALLHESALAIAHTANKNPWFEFQQLGNATPHEAMAYLFRRLASNPLWVQSNLSRMNDSERASYLKWQAFRQLLVARRHASLVLFELAMTSSQAPDPAALYQNLMSRAYGYRVDEMDRKYWAADHDLAFDSMDYFRAWLLEASVSASLELRFSERWFERKEAGAWLAEVWQSGSELGVDELLARIDLRTLDVTAFANRMKKRLQ